MRAIISNNELHPVTWHVSKVEDTLPFGLTKVTFAQDQFDPSRDNAELMIADYYSSAIEPVPVTQKPEKPRKGHSHISFNGTQQVLKVNGSYKTFTPHFFDRDENELDVVPTWSINYPDADDAAKFDVVYNGKNMKIKCLNYYDLVGKTITICLNDDSGTMPSTIEMEVVSL